MLSFKYDLYISWRLGGKNSYEFCYSLSSQDLLLIWNYSEFVRLLQAKQLCRLSRGQWVVLQLPSETLGSVPDSSHVLGWLLQHCPVVTEAGCSVCFSWEEKHFCSPWKSAEKRSSALECSLLQCGTNLFYNILFLVGWTLLFSIKVMFLILTLLWN